MDVLIIGGGIMGCTVALRLAQAGARVTVLERSIPGAEASSAAGGILGPQMEAEGPGAFLDLCLRSRAMYGAFSEELKSLTGIDVQYWPCGLLTAALDEAEGVKLEERVAWQKSIGLRAELLSGKEALALEPSLSTRVLFAAHFPDDHQVDNRLLVRALGLAAAKVGVKFRSGLVRSVIVEHGRAVGVDVEGERVSADAVVIAAGSWSGLVNGGGLEPSRVRPAKGQMVSFQTRLPLLGRIVGSPKGYLIPRRDGRLLAGSTVEFKGFDKTVTGEGLRRILAMAIELLPALADAAVEETWAGLRPYTEDHLPLIGPSPTAQLFLATGHFRNGILLAPITAKLVSEAVLGRKPSVDLAPFTLRA